MKTFKIIPIIILVLITVVFAIKIYKYDGKTEIESVLIGKKFPNYFFIIVPAFFMRAFSTFLIDVITTSSPWYFRKYRAAHIFGSIVPLQK